MTTRCSISHPSATAVGARGELEITDVNNKYIEQGSMTAEVLKGWRWTDAGTFESLYRATKVDRRGRGEQDQPVTMIIISGIIF